MKKYWAGGYRATEPTGTNASGGRQPARSGLFSISDIMAQGYVTGPLPRKILEAIQTKSRSKEIPIAECIDKNERLRYRRNLHVPETDTFHQQIIQKP